MKIPAARLLPASENSYYLHGEDRDALFESSEALLAEGSADAVRLRVDVGELDRIEIESRSQGLFGPSICYALVRNAESATPKQSDHLLKLATNVLPENRLIICAAGISFKKALHKKMLAEERVASCEFHMPSESGFAGWLRGEIETSGLSLTPEAESLVATELFGMRSAARQAIERFSLYDNGEGATLGIEVVGELLGERSPEDLGNYCAAVAARDGSAVSILRQLLREQKLAEVQVLGWLANRMQMLLLYSWYDAKGDRSALNRAKVFGDARRTIAAEARKWRGRELMLAAIRLIEAEQLLKGASIEEKYVVMERLTLDLVDSTRLEASVAGAAVG